MLECWAVLARPDLTVALSLERNLARRLSLQVVSCSDHRSVRESDNQAAGHQEEELRRETRRAERLTIVRHEIAPTKASIVSATVSATTRARGTAAALRCMQCLLA